MWQIIVYAVTVSAVLGLMGPCAEKLATMLGKPRRFIWALTMVLSILWPLAAVMRDRPAAIVAPIPEQAQSIEPSGSVPGFVVAPSVQPTAVEDAQRNASAAQPAKPSMLRPPSDRTLLVAWGLMSGAILLYLVGADLSLRHTASRWQTVTLGQAMHVSESTGPALFGALLPKIVVPRWFLDEPAATQALILEHELQHIRARDPLLLRLALLIVAVAPWNLPLWWQLRRLRQSIELDCDARVLGAGAEAAAYGKVLLAVTQRAGNLPLAAVAMSEPVSALELRIRSLVTGPARFSAPRGLAILALWGAGVGAAVSLEAPAIPAVTRPVPAAPAARPPAVVAAPAPAVAPARVVAPAQPAIPARTPDAGAQATSSNTGAVDLNIIPSDLRQRMEVVTGGASATYGSGAVAGVVNLVLNNRLTGFKLDMDYGINEAGDGTRPHISAAGGLPQFGGSGHVLIGVEWQGPASVRDCAAARAWCSDSRAYFSAPVASNWVDLRKLIGSNGDRFNRRFIVDPRVGVSVDIGDLDPASISYHAFLEVLGAHGFVAVRSGDVATIISGEFARTVASPVVRAANDLGDDAEVVTALIPIQGLSNPQLLGRSLSPWAQLSETPDGKSLLVMDKVANVKHLAAMVQGPPKAEQPVH